MASSSGDFGGPNAPPRCEARSKRSGVQCGGPAIQGTNPPRCRMHGGNATYGKDASGFVNGTHSRFLPSHMAELYEDALSNPELLDMSSNIALLDTRIKMLLNDWADDQPIPRWAGVLEVWNEAMTAILSGNPDKSMPAMERITQMLNDGTRWDQTWDEVKDTMEQLRRVADTEVKRKKELNQMIPIERVVVLMAAVAEAVKRNVRDPEQVKGVLRDLAVLHGSNNTAGGAPRLGPEVINVSPEHKGTKGGRSREALRNKINKRRRIATPDEDDVAAPAES